MSENPLGFLIWSYWTWSKTIRKDRAAWKAKQRSAS